MTPIATDFIALRMLASDMSKHPAAVALGSIKTAKKSAASAKNAKKATKARMKNLTPEERSEQARRAIQARWAKKR